MTISMTTVTQLNESVSHARLDDEQRSRVERVSTMGDLLVHYPPGALTPERRAYEACIEKIWTRKDKKRYMKRAETEEIGEDKPHSSGAIRMRLQRKLRQRRQEL